MGSQTSLPSNPGRRKRRDQGHLSFPSTIGECTPPPQIGNSSGRSTTTNRQPASGASQHNGTNGRQDDRGSQLDGEGPQHNGTNRRQNDRGSQLDGEGPQPSLRDYCPGSNGSDNGVRWAGTGDRNPSVARE